MNEQQPNPAGTEPNGNGGDSAAQADPALHQRLRAVTRDFNHRELAKLTGVSLETSRRYLEGRCVPGVAYLKGLCEALGISADWLLLGRGAPVYRPGVPLGKMDSSVDEVLDGLSRYLKRLHLELARAGTSLQQPLPADTPTAAGPEAADALRLPPPREVPPEEFADPFADEARPAIAKAGAASLSAMPIHVRLVLGPANGQQIALPSGAMAEIMVRVGDQELVELVPPGTAAGPGVQVYRRVFDRVYRWVGPLRSP